MHFALLKLVANVIDKLRPPHAVWTRVRSAYHIDVHCFSQLVENQSLAFRVVRGTVSNPLYAIHCKTGALLDQAELSTK